jgi:hypothetical protein
VTAARKLAAGRTVRRPRGRPLAVGAVLVAVGAAAAIALRGGRTIEPQSVIPTSTATVVRRSLVVHESVDGTLGFGERTPVDAPRAGVVTWLPAEGAVVRRGGRLLGLDGAPAAVLLYGPLPAWRTFEEGIPDGSDVLELERNLLALGLARGLALRPDRHFDVITRVAVERLQERLGLDLTGSLDAGLVRFSPSARRVAGLTTAVGVRLEAGAPALEVSSARVAASVKLSPDLRRYVAVGDRVGVLMPDGSTRPGTVSSVARVALRDDQGSSTVLLGIAVPSGRAGAGLDEASISVEIAKETSRNTLVVPAAALLVREGGSLAVEVVTAAGGRRLVPVTTGLYADGLVAVSGSGLRSGQRVTVPA